MLESASIKNSLVDSLIDDQKSKAQGTPGYDPTQMYSSQNIA